MKKFLLATLAVMMLISTVCFASPELAVVADTSNESTVFLSELAQETDENDIVLHFGEYLTNYEPSIRVVGEKGVRFKSGIATVAKYESRAYTVEEYGFVIARKDRLDAQGAELTLDFSKIAKGVAYNKKENIDIVFDSTNDDLCIFAGVIKGIPVEHYATDLICRTYVKLAVEGKEYIFYGHAVTGNLYELAKKFIAEGSEDEALLNIVHDYEMYASVPDAEGNLLAKGKFAVVATPNYCFNFSSDSLEYLPLGKNADNGDMVLVAMDNDAPINSINVNLEDIDKSLADTSSDSLVMMEYELVYKYSVDNGENTFEGIVSAVMNGSGKGTTRDVKVNYVEPQRSKDLYYCIKCDKWTENPKADGSMQICGEDIYFFDAPANSQVVKLVDFKQLSDGTYCYFIDDTRPLDTPEDLIVNLQRLYSGGKYYVDITDADGDGIYDYIQYMPATYGFMNGDTSVTFKEKMTSNAPVFLDNENVDENDFSFVPTIYYNGADIDGAECEDGDFVLAYLNPAANYIKVQCVVEPVTDSVRSYHKTLGRIEFYENGLHFCSRSYRAVEGFYAGDDEIHRKYTEHPFERHYFFGTEAFDGLLNVVSFSYEVTVYSVEIGGINRILYYDVPAVVEQPEEPEVPEEPVVLEEPYNYRIISFYDIGQDADELWRLNYNAYDPFFGTKSEYESVNGESKASQVTRYALESGVIVKITDDEKIDEKDENAIVGSVDFSNLVWIKSMDETSMTVVPIDETAECKNCVTKYMENHTGTTYNDILGNEQKSNVVKITENTKFSVMKRSSLDGNFFVDASINSVSMSDVIENGKSVLCYNTRCEDRNGNYVTGYANYKKAHILPNDNGEAVFVIIIVNDRDVAAYNVACENCQ